MVREGLIVSTITVGDEKELNNIFRIENENEVSIKTSNSCDSYDKNAVESPSDYEIREIVLGGLIDIETWNKIKRFERDNPDKIRKWREEDEEKHRDRYRNDSILNIRNRVYAKQEKKEKKGTRETCEEEVIKLCLLRHPKSKFVLSVSEYYNRNGRISEKQMDVLKSMIEK